MNRSIALSIGLSLALIAWWLAPERPRITAATSPSRETAAEVAPGIAATAGAAIAFPEESPGVAPGGAGPSLTRALSLAPPPPADPVRETAFADFASWVAAYQSARQTSRPEDLARLEEEGARLAKIRRDQMEDVLEGNPQRALELAVDDTVLAALPPSVAEWLETPVRGRGDLEVLAALYEPGQRATGPATWREAKLDGVRCRAFVFGERLGDVTLRGIPLVGVALGDRLAVAEFSTRRLADFPVPRAPAACVTCTASSPPATAAGEMILLDTETGPVAACCEEHAAAFAEAAEADLTAARNVALASSAATGQKRLILIRVDFADLPGAPFTDAQGTNVVKGIHQFYFESSYGRAGFRLVGEGSAITPTFRLAQTAAYYGSVDAAELRTAARDAASAGGYNLASFDYDLICFGRVPGFQWAGLGYVGAPGAWIRASFDGPGVSAHELGHNFGLPHANFWDTAGESVIGAGTTVEYGDSFDTMGSATAGRRHFNARFKRLLNWLTTAEIINVTTNGVHRLYAHDLADARGVRGLSVRKNAGTNYWLEFRQQFTDNPWAMNGVGLRWAGNGAQATRLLDLTPGSPRDREDSPLVVGRTFSDFAAGLHFTPLALGDDGHPYVEVAVNRGTFTNLAPPRIALAASQTNVAVRTPVTFIATADEPQGGLLAYHWDFGDNSLGDNQLNQTHSWNSAGYYRVRCTASNLRGGTASASALVRVGSPGTYTLAGRVWADREPVSDVRVSTSGGLSGLSDSDGRYVITGVPRGSVTLTAHWEGPGVLQAAFANPVNVTGHLTGLDFEVVPASEAEDLTLVPAGARWRFLDDGSDQGLAWRGNAFDDSGWEEGNARLGYGDNGIVTTVRFGSDLNNRHITTYFRHAFNVANPSELGTVTLGLLRDDGAVVYLNGREVFRSNLPGGPPDYRTLAASTVSGADETTFYETEIAASNFRSGRNVLAVEVHQVSPSSSDLAFDLRLTSARPVTLPPPRLDARIAAGGLRLTWGTGFGGWTVESSPAVAGAAWTRIAETAVRESEGWVVDLPFPSAPRFYRLVRP
jgi:hypothetical protein